MFVGVLDLEMREEGREKGWLGGGELEGKRENLIGRSGDGGKWREKDAI